MNKKILKKIEKTLWKLLKIIHSLKVTKTHREAT
jgi:hypothetical protein